MYVLLFVISLCIAQGSHADDTTTSDEIDQGHTISSMENTITVPDMELRNMTQVPNQMSNKIQESNAYVDDLLDKAFSRNDSSLIPAAVAHIDGFEIELDEDDGRYFTRGRKFGHRGSKLLKYALMYHLARSAFSRGKKHHGSKMGLLGNGLQGVFYPKLGKGMGHSAKSPPPGYGWRPGGTTSDSGGSPYGRPGGGTATPSSSRPKSSGGKKAGGRGRKGRSVPAGLRARRDLDRDVKVNLQSGRVSGVQNIRRLGDCSPPMGHQGRLVLSCYVSLDGVRVNFTGYVEGEWMDGWVIPLSDRKPFSMEATLKDSSVFVEVMDLPDAPPSVSAWSVLPSDLQLVPSRPVDVYADVKRILQEFIEINIDEDITDFIYGPLRDHFETVVAHSRVPLP